MISLYVWMKKWVISATTADGNAVFAICKPISHEKELSFCFCHANDAATTDWDAVPSSWGFFIDSASRLSTLCHVTCWDLFLAVQFLSFLPSISLEGLSFATNLLLVVPISVTAACVRGCDNYDSYFCVAGMAIKPEVLPFAPFLLQNDRFDDHISSCSIATHANCLSITPYCGGRAWDEQ